MPVTYIRSTVAMDRRAFKSVSTAVPSSHLVCGRWFSGPNTETFALIPLYNFALGEEERLSFPIYAGLFFYSKVHKPRPSFRAHFCCIDSEVSSIEYEAATHFSLRMESYCTCSQKSMPAPHSKCHERLRTLLSSAFDSTAPVPARHYHACALCMSGSIFSCTETKVGGLINIYQH